MGSVWNYLIFFVNRLNFKYISHNTNSNKKPYKKITQNFPTIRTLDQKSTESTFPLSISKHRKRHKPNWQPNFRKSHNNTIHTKKNRHKKTGTARCTCRALRQVYHPHKSARCTENAYNYRRDIRVPWRILCDRFEPGGAPRHFGVRAHPVVCVACTRGIFETWKFSREATLALRRRDDN